MNFPGTLSSIPSNVALALVIFGGNILLTTEPAKGQSTLLPEESPAAQPLPVNFVYNGSMRISERGFEPESSTWIRRTLSTRSVVLLGQQQRMQLTMENPDGSRTTQAVGVHPLATFELQTTGRGAGMRKEYRLTQSEPRQFRFPDPVDGPWWGINGGIFYPIIRLDAAGRNLQAILTEDPTQGTLSGRATRSRPAPGAAPAVFARRLDQNIDSADSWNLASTLPETLGGSGFVSKGNQRLQFSSRWTDNTYGLNFETSVIFLRTQVERQGYQPVAP
jgi:hypothetical protein